MYLLSGLANYLLSSLLAFNIIISLPNSSKLNEFVFEFKGTELVYNDHVGNEWLTVTKLNNQLLYSGDKIKININPGEEIQLISFLSETNEKHVDKATNTYSLTYNDFIKHKNGTFYTEVKIKESNGRYAGNYAKMRFYYAIY